MRTGASRLPRLLGAATLPCLLCALLATPAGATPAWLTPLPLSTPGHNAEAPQLALDGAGNAIAVWSRSNGTNTIIQTATRPVGGPWQAPLELSIAGQNASEPQLAVDGAGDAVAVWRRYDGANYIVQAASRQAGGTWQQPLDLSAAGQNAEAPQVAIDSAGDAIAVWSRSDGTNTILQASSRVAGGAWQTPIDLSATGWSAASPQIAIAPSGDAVAVWRRATGAGTLIERASKPPGGYWQPPLPLSAAGQNASEPQLAVNGAGDALAIWLRSDGTNTIVQSSERPVGGDWRTPRDLSEAGQNSSEPQIAVDSTGVAIAVWRRYSGTHDIVQSATKPAGGTWQAPLDLSEDGQNASEPELTFDSAGNAIAVWSRSNGTNTIIQSASRPSSGGWGAAVDLSTIGRSAFESQISADAEGNAAAIWSRFDGANTVIQAAGYDAAGPRLASLQVPTAGTVRRPLSFSVSPLDVWSAIGSTTWSFGDGTVAAGSSVGHAYSRPGVYTVSMSAADALGNVTGASRIVTIFAKASAARNVLVRERTAALRLHCPSSASCEGDLRLIAAVEVRRHHRHVAKRLQIGRKSFDIPAEMTTTVLVDISAKGRMAVRGAGRLGLKAQLTGTGVKHRVLVLRAPTPGG